MKKIAHVIFLTLVTISFGCSAKTGRVFHITSEQYISDLKQTISTEIYYDPKSENIALSVDASSSVFFPKGFKFKYLKNGDKTTYIDYIKRNLKHNVPFSETKMPLPKTYLTTKPPKGFKKKGLVTYKGRKLLLYESDGIYSGYGGKIYIDPKSKYAVERDGYNEEVSIKESITINKVPYSNSLFEMTQEDNNLQEVASKSDKIKKLSSKLFDKRINTDLSKLKQFDDFSIYWLGNNIDYDGYEDKKLKNSHLFVKDRKRFVGINYGNLEIYTFPSEKAAKKFTDVQLEIGRIRIEEYDISKYAKKPEIIKNGKYKIYSYSPEEGPSVYKIKVNDSVIVVLERKGYLYYFARDLPKIINKLNP